MPPLLSDCYHCFRCLVQYTYISVISSLCLHFHWNLFLWYHLAPAPPKNEQESAPTKLDTTGQKKSNLLSAVSFPMQPNKLPLGEKLLDMNTFSVKVHEQRHKSWNIVIITIIGSKLLMFDFIRCFCIYHFVGFNFSSQHCAFTRKRA